MSHFIGGPNHAAPVPAARLNDYRIMVGKVHYMRRVDSSGRVDFAIYGMLDTNVELLLSEIYSTEDV